MAPRARPDVCVIYHDLRTATSRDVAIDPIVACPVEKQTDAQRNTAHFRGTAARNLLGCFYHAHGIFALYGTAENQPA